MYLRFLVVINDLNINLYAIRNPSYIYSWHPDRSESRHPSRILNQTSWQAPYFCKKCNLKALPHYVSTNYYLVIDTRLKIIFCAISLRINVKYIKPRTIFHTNINYYQIQTIISVYVDFMVYLFQLWYRCIIFCYLLLGKRNKTS